MPDYRKGTVSGTTWQRCCRVDIRNPLNGPSVVDFYEEQVIVLSETDTLLRTVGGCSMEFSPTSSIPVYDTTTGTQTGTTITHADVYTALYSAYMAAALARDAA